MTAQVRSEVGDEVYDERLAANAAEIAELNIGHFLIGEAIFTGLDAAVKRMRALMDEARAESAL